MKINNNLNIQNNNNNLAKETNKEKGTTSQKEVQQNAENIKGSYNVAFFGLFGKKKKQMTVDARYLFGSMPLSPNTKYTIGNDAVFQIGNNVVDLCSPQIKPYIDGIPNEGRFILGINPPDINGWRTVNPNDEHIQVSKDKDGILYAENISKTHPVSFLPNVITPSLYYPFNLAPNRNYYLPDNCVMYMGKTRVSLKDLGNVITPLQNGQSLIIGRGQGSNIIFDYPGVSRQHMQITKMNDGVLVKDLNSTNGTSFQTVEKSYKQDFCGIDKPTRLYPHIPTRIPSDSQIYLGNDLTIDMRKSDIRQALDEKGSITIGRSPDSDIVVEQTYNQVSKKHLTLEKIGGDIVATDSGSTNGTIIVPKNAIKPFYGDLNNLSLNQGNIGDCYLLSAIYALSRNPVGQRILMNMVSVADDGSYIVKFNKENPITVSIDELDGQTKSNGQKKISVSGDLGIKAIERAYAKMLKREAERKKLIKFYSEGTMFYKIDEGGYVNVALKRLSGVDSVGHSTRSHNIYNTLNDIAASGVRNHMLTCTTPNKAKYDRYTDPEHRFISGHAYAIKDVDAGNRTLSVVNPHNTKMTYLVSWDEFTKYFDYMYDAMA